VNTPFKKRRFRVIPYVSIGYSEDVCIRIKKSLNNET